MINVDFVKLSPTGNTTVLVKTPVPRPLQAETGARLLGKDSVFAEQAGFIEDGTLPFARARLQMSGGEFCGNGAMAMAAYIARKDGLAVGESAEIPLEVSGTEKLITCKIKALANGAFTGTVDMPLPTDITRRSLGSPTAPLDLWAVSFPGITHVILPFEIAKALSSDPKSFAESVIRSWARTIGAQALGIMLLDEDSLSIAPLVFVSTPNTLFWETGCGSGTAAVGAYLANTSGKSGRYRISQPGGVITASTRVKNGHLTGLSISGNVKLVTEGTAYL